jgi:uncharacterized protein
MKAALLISAVLLAVAACNRTPAEPAPSSSQERQSIRPESSGPHPFAPATTTSSAKCIRPTPSAAPAIPPPVPASACPPDPEPNAKLAHADVTFPEAPSSPKVDVEIVKTPDTIEKGLMYRRSMPEDAGMLFKLDSRREHTFWMHNTCIPLDMLFVDEDGTIVGIVEGAAPLTDSVRTVGCPSLFVLEVNGGWTRKRGVRAGQKMTIPFAAR